MGIAFNLWVARLNGSGWGVDFNQFYAASKLAGTGELYNYAELSKLETHGPPMPTGRLPVVMYGVKAISWLPYRAAQAVWLAGSLAALVLTIAWWPGASRAMMATALAWQMPATLLLVLGQDTPFWLMWVALGLLLVERKRPRLAGAVFALCICKFHLSLGIPILLAARREWRALASGAVVSLVLLAACFVIEGPHWPAQYMVGFRMPVFSPAAYRMPNLHGIAYWTPWPGVVETALAAGVIALLWMLARRAPALGAAGAAASAAGLLLGGHAYANDCALLAPLVAFAIQRPAAPKWLKVWAVALLTPAPILLLVTAKPFWGQIPLVGFAMAAMIWEWRRAARVGEKIDCTPRMDGAQASGQSK